MINNFSEVKSPISKNKESTNNLKKYSPLKDETKTQNFLFDPIKIFNFQEKPDGKSLLKRAHTTLQSFFDLSSPLYKKKKNKIQPILTYHQKIWRKNFFIIIFFVKKFMIKILLNHKNSKMNNLNKLHFDLIDDLAYFYQNEQNEKIINKEKWKKKFLKIVQASHSNKLKISFKKFIYCKKKYNF